MRRVGGGGANNMHPLVGKFGESASTRGSYQGES